MDVEKRADLLVSAVAKVDALKGFDSNAFELLLRRLPDPQKRASALGFLSSCKAPPPNFDFAQSSVSGMLIVGGDLHKWMLADVDQGGPDGLVAWNVIVNLLGVTIHQSGAGTTILNGMLQIVEKAFKHSSNDVRKAAYHSWTVLMDNFATNMNVLASAKRIKLITRPLVGAISNRNEEQIKVKFKTWWYYIGLFKADIRHHVEAVVLPFLRFCYSGTNANTTASPTVLSPAKRYDSVRILCLEAMAIVLCGLNDVRASNLDISAMDHLKDGGVLQPGHFAKHYSLILQCVSEAFETVQISRKTEAGFFAATMTSLGKLAEALANANDYSTNKDAHSAVGHFLLMVENVLAAMERSDSAHNVALAVLGQVKRLPSQVLTSTSIWQFSVKGATREMPAAVMVKLMLRKDFLAYISQSDLVAAAREKYFALVEKFSSTVCLRREGGLRLLAEITDLLKETCVGIPPVRKDVTVTGLWKVLATIYKNHVETFGEVNEINSKMEHKLDASKGLLMFPFQHFPNSTSKLVWKLWTEIFKLATVNASLIVTYKTLELEDYVASETLKGLREPVGVNVYSNLCQHLCQQLVSSIPCQSLSQESPDVSFGSHTNPLGRSRKVVDLLVHLAKLTLDLKDKRASSVATGCTSLAHQLSHLLTSVTSQSMIRPLLKLLVPAIVVFLDKSLLSLLGHKFESQAKAVFELAVNKIQARYDGKFSKDFLADLKPLVLAAMNHSNRDIKTKVFQMWQLTFGPALSDADVPKDLHALLKQSGSEMSSSSQSSSFNGDSQQKFAVPLTFGSFLDKAKEATTTSVNANQVQTKSSDKKQKSRFNIDDENTQDFVPISSPSTKKRLLTEHQKERMTSRKDDIPALYSELSRDDSMICLPSQFQSQMSTDDSQMSVDMAQHSSSLIANKHISDKQDDATTVVQETPQLMDSQPPEENGLDDSQENQDDSEMSQEEGGSSQPLDRSSSRRKGRPRKNAAPQLTGKKRGRPRKDSNNTTSPASAEKDKEAIGSRVRRRYNMDEDNNKSETDSPTPKRKRRRPPKYRSPSEEKESKAREVEEAKKAKEAEEARKAENAKKDEEAKLAKEAEEARKNKEAEEAKKAKEAEKAREAKRAEDARQAAEARKAKEAEDTRKAEEARKAKEAKKAEDARKAKEAEDARKAKEAEEARKAEVARKAKEAEDARKAEVARKAKEAETARKAKEAEEARNAKEAEIARKAEEAKKAKEVEIARKAKEAEEARKAKEAEEARKAEEAKKAKEAEIARKAKEAEDARKAEEAKKAKEADIARKAKEAEEARKAKEAEIARKAKEAEEARLAKEAKKAKKAQKAQKIKEAENARRAQEAEDARKAKEARKAIKAEAARKIKEALEARKAEKAEQARKAKEAEEARKGEEAEEARKAEEVKAKAAEEAARKANEENASVTAVTSQLKSSTKVHVARLSPKNTIISTKSPVKVIHENPLILEPLVGKRKSTAREINFDKEAKIALLTAESEQESGKPITRKRKRCSLSTESQSQNGPRLRPTRQAAKTSSHHDITEELATKSGGKENDAPKSGRLSKANKYGETPLHLAVKKGDTEKVTSLLATGVDVNAKDNAGWTPMHEAMREGPNALEILSLLVSNGADVNAKGHTGSTALHDAVSYMSQDTVQFLLENGADPSIVNNEGKSPLSIVPPRLSHLFKECQPLKKATGRRKVKRNEEWVVSEKLRNSQEKDVDEEVEQVANADDSSVEICSADSEETSPECVQVSSTATTSQQEEEEQKETSEDKQEDEQHMDTDLAGKENLHDKLPSEINKTTEPSPAFTAADDKDDLRLIKPPLPVFKGDIIGKPMRLGSFNSSRGARLLEMSKAKAVSDCQVSSSSSVCSSPSTSTGQCAANSPSALLMSPRPDNVGPVEEDLMTTPTRSGNQPWQKFAPSPSDASPSVSILKRLEKTGGASSPSSECEAPPVKRRRVQFKDPPVSEQVEIPRCPSGKATRQRLQETRFNRDMFLPTIPTELSSQDVDGDTEEGSNGLYEQTPPVAAVISGVSPNCVYPSLVNCDEPVTAILTNLATKTWLKAAEKSLTENGIEKIRDLSRLTAVKANALKGLKPPSNLCTIKEALRKFEKTLQRREKEAKAPQTTNNSENTEGEEILDNASVTSQPLGLAPFVEISTPEEDDQAMKELYERPSPSPTELPDHGTLGAGSTDGAKPECQTDSEASPMVVNETVKKVFVSAETQATPPVVSVTHADTMTNKVLVEEAGVQAQPTMKSHHTETVAIKQLVKSAQTDPATVEERMKQAMDLLQTLDAKRLSDIVCRASKLLNDKVTSHP